MRANRQCLRLMDKEIFARNYGFMMSIDQTFLIDRQN